MTQHAVARPGEEFDLADQLGLHPFGPAQRRGRNRREGRALHCEAVELRVKVARQFGGEAGADAPRIAQLLVLVIAEKKRADARAALLLRQGEAADDEFLPAHAFAFEPIPAAARFVGLAGAFRDDALEGKTAGMLEHVVARRLDMVGVADRSRHARRLAEIVEDFLSLRQRCVAQIIAVEMQKIEDDEGKPPVIAAAEHILECREARDALLVEHGYLAIDGEALGGDRLHVLRRAGRTAWSSPGPCG